MPARTRAYRFGVQVLAVSAVVYILAIYILYIASFGGFCSLFHFTFIFIHFFSLFMDEFDQYFKTLTVITKILPKHLAELS